MEERESTMGYSIDVDTGGTCTDGLFSDGKNLIWVKVDTTPHDLTIAFNNCLEEGSKKLGFRNTMEFLDQVDIIRWSNTIATNVIAEKTGPKVGLFVSKGYEESLYTSTTSPALGHLVDRSNIVGLPQSVNATDFLKALKELLARGVRRIVICLKESFYDNQEELRLKNIIIEQYPEHYLGSVPILTGEEICKHPDDMTRTHAALLNAYVHGPMATSLFREEDYLREKGYTKPLLIGHIDGGVSRVSKTKPIDTIESGPVFGIHGSVHFSKVYDLDKVITLDVGGTTSKIGWIYDGKPTMLTDSSIFGIPLKISLINLTSIALGGGTVAYTEKDKKITLGPRSMGAYPGPASYNLGGREATLTDAFVVLGYLNPECFAGGAKKLHVGEAEAVLRERIADPLNIDLETAAQLIVDTAFNYVVEEVKSNTKNNKELQKHVLFTFGGNGSLFACPVAEKLGVDKVYTFSIGPVFSTFGSSTADISHSYEYAPFVAINEYSKLREIIETSRKQAFRDMEGEGLDLEYVEITLSFQMSDGKNPPIMIESDYLKFDSDDDVEKIKGVFNELAPSGYSRDKLIIEVLKIIAKHPSPTPELISFPKGSADQKEALKGKRGVYWNDGYVSTRIYDWDLLQAGNVVKGPAIIESDFTNHLIPPAWELTVDEHNNGIIEKQEKESHGR